MGFGLRDVEYDGLGFKVQDHRWPTAWTSRQG